MDGGNVIIGFPSDIGDFRVGASPIEGAAVPGYYSSEIGRFDTGRSPIAGQFRRGSYSSAIGLFVIGHSPIGLAYTPNPNMRRVIFLLPEYPDQFEMPELEDAFALPAPEGWSY